MAALCLYSAARSSRYYGQVSLDGFGTRTLSIDPETGDAVEVLTLSATLAGVPEFAAATGERVARLARVRHTMYAKVRGIARPSDEALLLYSDHVPGWRLSEVLKHVERERWRLDVSMVLALMRQLIPAVALFSRHQRDATIGTIGPERLILTPQGRLVLAEYVLAPGLERLQYSRDRLWREFRVALPPTASATKIPPTADAVGIGVVVLSLLLGRLLRDDEYLVSLGDLFESLTETSNGTTRPLSATFHRWIARALQFEAESSFQTTQEAQVAFEEMLAKERSYVTSSAQLNQFLVTYERFAGDPPVSARATPTASYGEASPAALASARAELAPTDGDASPVAARANSPASYGEASPAAFASARAELAPTDGDASPVASAFARADFRPSGNEASPPAREDPMASDSEASPIVQVSPATPERPAGWRKYALGIAAAIAVLEAIAIAWLVSGSGPAVLGRGELVVQSRPVAARVTIDGEERGITPLTTELSAGSHVLEVRVGRSEPRVIPLMIRPGVQTGLYVELQSVATVGGLEVRTDPPRAQVTVGGQDRGVTPLVLRDLPPGEVEVIIRLGGREVRQVVRIEPGITTQLVVPLGR
ncbi:MAG TPA: PEGA domain-containing protein [Vicinamibacterales bacterium]|nr:PEGA domain-containing protein [Vicinamibacterales bacterium]